MPRGGGRCGDFVSQPSVCTNIHRKGWANLTTIAGPSSGAHKPSRLAVSEEDRVIALCFFESPPGFKSTWI